MRASWGIESTSPPRRHAFAVVAACALTFACGIDDRTLVETEGSSAGRPNGSAGTSSTPSGSAGTAGQAANIEIPVCVYDGDVGPECRTLVDNAGFDSETSPWKPQDGLLGAWEKADAANSETSGSIRIVNFLHGEDAGFAPGAAVQCIRGSAGKYYDLAADVFISEGQGAGTGGETYKSKAGLGVFFFRTTDCSEDSIGNVDAPLIDEAGAWVHNQTTARAPELTQSLSVRLATLMPFRQNKFEALFDNVLVRER